VLARVVVNCGAGSVDGGEVTRQRAEIVEAFAAAGASCEIAFVPGEELESAIRAAAEAAPDVVAVAGGDGSLGTAAAVLAGGDVPLGVLPLGTFNHFAKDLGLPLDLEEAAATAVSGALARIDVAEVNGRCFVNNSSIGVYPAMVGIRDRIREERGWGKVRAAPVAAVRVLRRFPVRRLRIQADGYRAELRTPFLFMGNNRYEIGPSGVGERSVLDRGELCLYVARAASRRKLVGIALRSVVRGAGSVPELDEHCATEVTIDAHGHRLSVAVDGEVTTLRTPLRYRSRPGALLVRTVAPAGAGLSPADAAGADAQPVPPG
jgi:diacylglycerol kinase family enzyme